MAEPICEDDGLMQEWAPLTQLLQQIPLKTQRSLFSKNLNLTCLDVIPEFIALGTNFGFIYWYCRPTGDLQRLRLENYNCCVTCVKIMSYADYMVAAGTNQGTVIIFQIPKIQYEGAADQAKPKQKQMERFIVNGLHKSSVTSIEWDPNQMKVFSGDKSGGVVLTEIDLSLHISKSMELLNEQLEIVQLSYSQNILLISTVYRSIICDGSNNWKVCQVGTKERKILGKYGAALCQFPHGSVLFASRPGHRMWLSDKNGTVQQTLIFKSAIQSKCPKIQLMNPIDKKEPYDTSFGKVIQFGDNKLITYNSEIMYVLHPGAVSIISVLIGARKILDLAVNENEVFILEGERSLLRIGILPDKYSLDILYQPVSRRTSFNLDELAAKLKDTAVESIKKITKDFISADKQSPGSPPAVADEALELPPVVALNAGLMSALLTGKNDITHSAFPNQDPSTSANFSHDKSDKNSPLSVSGTNDFSVFNQDLAEEIIIRPARKRRNKSSKVLPSSKDSALLSESGSDTRSNLTEDRLVCGVANDQSLSDESAFSESQSSFSVLQDISSLRVPRNFEGGSEEMMKTSDTKSQTSLDTCESVSERLLLPSEPFRDEREKAFALLRDHSLFSSHNSEKTDDMSISVNVTTSSSVSSKISENLPSPSYESENSGMAFRMKSAESQSIDNFEGELQSPSKECWCLNDEKRSCTESSSESSVSNRDLQKELCSNWPEESEGGCGGIFSGSPGGQPKAFDRNPEASKESFDHEAGVAGNVVTDAAENDLVESARDSKIEDISELNSCPKDLNGLGHFSGAESFLKSEEGERKGKQEEDDEDQKASEFLSNESLKYGPPSGSSMISSHPSSDSSIIPSAQQNCQPLAQDSLDHWPEYSTPRKITSLAACNNYVICTNHKGEVYYSPLPGLGLSWRRLKYKASMVRVNSDGTAVWLLRNKTVSALVNLSSNSPVSDSVEKIARNIKTFALDNITKDGLLVTITGEIISYEALCRESGDRVPCHHIITDIVCSGGVILASSSDCTLLCKAPEEDAFRIVKTPKPTSSLALGPDNLLWMIDETNDIFFSDDYLNENPHWWQIQISDYIFQNPPRSPENTKSNRQILEALNASVNPKNCLIATNENSVWVYNKFDSTVCVNKTGFTGYMWNKVSPVNALPDIHWRTLCAGGAVEDNDHVWLLSVDGDIFWTTPNHQYFQSVPLPCEESLVCMTSSVGTLWVLNESGGLYSRLGLNSGKNSGVSWKEVRSLQIDNLRFVWISCGTEVVWACDVHGRTFTSTGSPQHMASLDAAWTEVGGRPKDVQFEKVFVGSQPQMVWAVDSNQNLYVREGIFPHYQVGTNWVYVCGIKASHVTISGTHVWALTSAGEIYRRCGVSESNFVGDYWRRIPGNLKVISSFRKDELWGISEENKILRLSYRLKILRERETSSEHGEGCDVKEDISWEIVQ